MAENEPLQIRHPIRRLFPHTGKTQIVGVTGAPGVGKSTLVDQLVELLRARGQSVGVIAVDPTSPFTGGAILADRLRMQRHGTDTGVFIRSMATRGRLGGLARATSDSITVMEAMGKEVVIVETVGVGQDEVEVAKYAYTTIVMLIPGAGDDVQAMKAGVMEIGDCFVINKADREGADMAVKQVQSVLALKEFGEEEWRPPVIRTVAITGDGVDELLEILDQHYKHFVATGELERFHLAKCRTDFLAVLEETLSRYVLDEILSDGALDQLVASIASRKIDPYTAADEILAQLKA
ncbi:MAG: methylmalonyl Co-A mutase-associated GTPase MeaB [Nitrospinae bacterium]|nr:methylmalonyl Co-A mutase-associated GTPase MeaB [Nitrospinota bacterium]